MHNKHHLTRFLIQFHYIYSAHIVTPDPTAAVEAKPAPTTTPPSPTAALPWRDLCFFSEHALGVVRGIRKRRGARILVLGTPLRGQLALQASAGPERLARVRDEPLTLNSTREASAFGTTHVCSGAFP